jgi:hypothetical protein
MYPDGYARPARTMTLPDVKDFALQLLQGVLAEIPHSNIRAAVRRRVFKMTGDRLRKAKEEIREAD